MRRLQVARVKNRVAVLVDRSASMAFPVAPGGPPRNDSRGQRARALAPEMAALEIATPSRSYGFDPELSPSPSSSS